MGHELAAALFSLRTCGMADPRPGHHLLPLAGRAALEAELAENSVHVRENGTGSFWPLEVRRTESV